MLFDNAAMFLLLEIFAGSAHLSQASREAGLATGPIHRQIASRWQKLCGTGLVDAGGSSCSVGYVDNVASDVDSPRLSLYMFWSPMTHMRRHQDITSNEQTRMQELVFIAFLGKL